ncbi:hypothetical protein QN277_023550 [Acacia crassicarpa]|uniref:Uncharacterized protein n=1 Tax=Acacia crassicarpa TaxID=499986 RepID=A0AAE1MRR1_9FABA|nr:hypothetical protein QN277_023550 [Acacia crassicarpa]
MCRAKWCFSGHLSVPAVKTLPLSTASSRTLTSQFTESRNSSFSLHFWRSLSQVTQRLAVSHSPERSTLTDPVPDTNPICLFSNSPKLKLKQRLFTSSLNIVFLVLRSPRLSLWLVAALYFKLILLVFSILRSLTNLPLLHFILKNCGLSQPDLKLHLKLCRVVAICSNPIPDEDSSRESNQLWVRLLKAAIFLNVIF